MVPILVVNKDDDMRHAIVAALPDRLGQKIILDNRLTAIGLLSERWQVMIYAVHHGDDLDWLADAMRRHLELRVLYFSPTPWASLRYDRARCMIAPPKAEALKTGALVDLVQQLLPPVEPKFGSTHE